MLETAARALQRDGIDGSGLAGLMGEAGLTKGGFYAHFQSKDDLVAEAVSTSLQAAAVQMRATLRASGDQELDGFRAIVEAYLQPAHAVANEGGCTIGALLSEPDPKVVEQYQYVVIQAVFAKRWSEAWHGLVLPDVSIAGKGCGIPVI